MHSVTVAVSAWYGGRRFCEPQPQAPAVHFRCGCKLFRKPSIFHRCDSGYMLSVSSRWLLDVFPARKLYSDPEVVSDLPS